MSIEHEVALSDTSFRSVVDIGANIGQFSLFCVAHFPRAKVYAFEPLARPARRFRGMFERHGNIVLFQTAIGPEDGTAVIHVSGRDDSSSLLPIGELQDKLFPGTAETSTENVTVGRLTTYISSDMIQHPALLKIDVQGFELEALMGCSDLLDSFDSIYVECSFVELYEGQHLASDVVAYLSERGFRLTGTFNTVSDDELGPIQADLMFRNL